MLKTIFEPAAGETINQVAEQVYIRTRNYPHYEQVILTFNGLEIPCSSKDTAYEISMRYWDMKHKQEENKQ